MTRPNQERNRKGPIIDLGSFWRRPRDMESLLKRRWVRTYLRSNKLNLCPPAPQCGFNEWNYWHYLTDKGGILPTDPEMLITDAWKERAKSKTMNWIKLKSYTKAYLILLGWCIAILILIAMVVGAIWYEIKKAEFFLRQ